MYNSNNEHIELETEKQFNIFDTKFEKDIKTVGDQAKAEISTYIIEIISKIKVKRLSNQFRESLLYMAEEIVAPEDKGKVKKAFKQLEKEV